MDLETFQEDNDANSFSAADLAPVTRKKKMFILISSFLTICITIGFNQSYGVFQSYYTSAGQDILPAGSEKQGALIAFVGTLGAGLTWGGSIVVNPLMARVKDVRFLTVAGVVCMSAGFGLASLSSKVRVHFSVDPFV
jgi:drug/metabolite transporter (DMT)-like permease